MIVVLWRDTEKLMSDLMLVIFFFFSNLFICSCIFDRQERRHTPLYVSHCEGSDDVFIQGNASVFGNTAAMFMHDRMSR